MIIRGRQEEAWNIIANMYSRAGDEMKVSARQEFEQICQQIEADRSFLEAENIWSLFTKPTYRRRMLCGFFTFFSNESTGILVIYSGFHTRNARVYTLTPIQDYSVLIYKGLGFTDNIPLLLSGIYVTIGALGNYVNSILADRVGRKALFIVGLSGCLISLIFETVLDAQYANTTNRAGLRAAIFFLFLHLAL